MTPGQAAISLHDGYVRLAVRVTPRAKRSAVQGLGKSSDEAEVILLRLAAPPVDGAANKALIALVADALRVPRSTVSIASGETSRRKVVEIAGDGPTLRKRVEQWLAEACA